MLHDLTGARLPPPPSSIDTVGHSANEVVKNQLLAIINIPNSSVPSSYEPGGREFEFLRARQFQRI